jgi:hypothetical protein
VVCQAPTSAITPPEQFHRMVASGVINARGDAFVLAMLASAGLVPVVGTIDCGSGQDSHEFCHANCA